MIRILANDGIHPSGQRMMEDAGYDVDLNKIEQADLATKLNNYDAIIVRSATKVRENLIDVSPNLKVIARGGVGLDNIDVDYAKSKGIRVYNTPAASSKSVAELAFSHIFALARGLHYTNRELPKENADFKGLKKRLSKGFELQGKTLGIIGLGRIGQETARIACALGMRVIGVDIVVNEVDVAIEINQGFKQDIQVKIKAHTMGEMLRNADIISLHVPFSGKPLIGQAEIEKMKNGAMIINTARGGAVDEEALLENLNNGKLGGAGVDVFINEPRPKQELLDHPLISVSPHIGASTGEAQARIGIELAEKIIDFFSQN